MTQERLQGQNDAACHPASGRARHGQTGEDARAEMERLDIETRCRLRQHSDPCAARYGMVVGALELEGERFGFFNPGPPSPPEFHLSPEEEHAYRWRAGRESVGLVVGSDEWRRWYRKALAFFALAAEYAAQQETRAHHRTPKPARPKCGARCRDGHACQASAVWDAENDRPRNGRCRNHGGLSTGPRTVAGRARVAAAARRRAREVAMVTPKKASRKE